jgi:hypothetical protein
MAEWNRRRSSTVDRLALPPIPNKVVMVGLVPTIHAFFLPPHVPPGAKKSWMVATSATMTAERGLGLFNRQRGFAVRRP